MNLMRPETNYLIGSDIVPCNLKKQEVEDYAENVADECGFFVGADPLILVDELGGRTHFEDISSVMSDGGTGSIFVHSSDDFDICLPTYTSPLRDRFTAAHELGHYFLHSEQGDIPIIAFRNGSTRIEWEANWFAAALLMPRAAFMAACEQTSSIAVLASQFGVSQDAARVRQKAIGSD
ncbi:MAG: ImmA/IrrE family metallo-endopeptidase [Planctomycetes bacterium]|nr:ImmA/IrrE family metallo-endopeptidase [Planctomycetota bacterium]